MKTLVLLGSIFFSYAGFAAEPNFDVLKAFEEQNSGHECAQKAWRDAGPTDQQNTQAHAFMVQAKAVHDQHKAEIEAAMRGMHAAWMRHPISKEEVKAAAGELHTHMAPVHIAMSNAKIDIINLLSDDQRKLFDRSMMDCMHHP